MKIYTLIAVLMATFVFLPIDSVASEIQDYTVKVGEVVRLDIPSTGKALLSRATNKRGQWDVNALYLEVVSSSWDHAYVRGLKETNLASVQLTVTFNMNGHYGDHYYAAYHVKVLPDGPTSISLTRTKLTLEPGEEALLHATITGSPGTYRWSSDNEDVVRVNGSGLDGYVTAVGIGVANVTVTANGKYSSTCRITVTSPAAGVMATVEAGKRPVVRMEDGSLIFDREADVTLYDMNGRMVYSGMTQRIDNLQTGLYILATQGTAQKVAVGLWN